MNKSDKAAIIFDLTRNRPFPYFHWELIRDIPYGTRAAIDLALTDVLDDEIERKPLSDEAKKALPAY